MSVICLTVFPVSSGYTPVRYHAKVPVHTERKIQHLCTEALAARTEAEVERVIPELQAAIQEHIRLAKTSLQEQVSALAALDLPKRPGSSEQGRKDPSHEERKQAVK